MKRIVSLLFISVICLFAFAACASQESTKNVEVFIINQIDNETLSETLSLPDASAAGEYFRQLCNKNDLAIEGIDEGYVTLVGELENGDTNAWMFYVNGELCDVGVKDYVPADGDKIELIYLDWTQLSFE
ncbi:MAG: DUF4430 domain-containing protein [Ruminococcaceae bacterium]|nr:DUF4430 domain-containing protein [Oscillospiraceae bacterium]